MRYLEAAAAIAQTQLGSLQHRNATADNAADTNIMFDSLLRRLTDLEEQVVDLRNTFYITETPVSPCDERLATLQDELQSALSSTNMSDIYSLSGSVVSSPLKSLDGSKHISQLKNLPILVSALHYR